MIAAGKRGRLLALPHERDEVEPSAWAYQSRRTQLVGAMQTARDELRRLVDKLSDDDVLEGLGLSLEAGLLECRRERRSKA